MPEDPPPPTLSAVKATQRRSLLRDALRTARLGYRVKKVAWRLTAACAWISGLMHILGVGYVWSDLIDVLTTPIASILTTIGLSPTTHHSAGLLRLGWLLIITNFSPLELIGFAIYSLLFPLSVAGIVFFRKASAKNISESQVQAKKQGLGTSGRPTHFRSQLACALLAWYLLYDNSVQPLQVWIGAFFAGLLFVASVIRSVAGARPLDPEDVVFFPMLERLFYVVAASIKPEKPGTRTDARFQNALFRPMMKLARWTALLIRGRQGKARVMAMVMVEYIVSFIILGVVAILCWALILRALVPSMTNSQAVQVILAHFFSSLTAPKISQPLPLWMDVGPSATSWVLFVLFIGPVASLLPQRQHAYSQRLLLTYRRLRTVAVFLMRYVKALDRHEAVLPFLV